jgi:hypothetical protein
MASKWRNFTLSPFIKFVSGIKISLTWLWWFGFSYEQMFATKILLDSKN